MPFVMDTGPSSDITSGRYTRGFFSSSGYSTRDLDRIPGMRPNCTLSAYNSLRGTSSLDLSQFRLYLSRKQNKSELLGPKKKKKTFRITDTKIHLVKCPATSFRLPLSKAPATSSSPSLRARTQLQPTSTLCAPRRLNSLRTLPRDSIRSRLGLSDPRTIILRRRSMSSVVRLMFWYVPFSNPVIILNNIDYLIGRGYRNHPPPSPRRLCFLPRRIQGQGLSLTTLSLLLLSVRTDIALLSSSSRPSPKVLRSTL